MQSSRRQFLKLSLSATGSSMLFGLQHANAEGAALNTRSAHYPLLELHPDNSITLINSRSEMGQGVTTLLAQYLLEEMDADWSQVKAVKQAGADATLYGHQNTIGAISSFLGWWHHRAAGAQIRHLLLHAAAKRWQVAVEQCAAERGMVKHLTSNKLFSFGELAGDIDGKDLPENLPVKDPSEFRIIGLSKSRLDIPDKIKGKAVYGIDVQQPNIHIACILRCPIKGGTLKQFEASDALKLKGVEKVIQISAGIAIIARNYWLANKAKALIKAEWNEGGFAVSDSHSLMQSFKQQLSNPQNTLFNKGDSEAVLKQSSNKVELEFEFPLVAHACMEPMNCTARADEKRCEIWAPTQNRNDARQAVMDHFGYTSDAIDFNTTLMGGGFGRRAQEDFVLEAVELARLVEYPIKVVWSREDDIQHDYYRSANCQSLAVACDENGKLIAYKHHLVAHDSKRDFFDYKNRGTDAGNFIAYGGAEDLAYDCANASSRYSLIETPINIGILRGISHGYTNFAREVAIEELAKQNTLDPLEFRLQQLKEGRARDVLLSLREKLKEQISTDTAVGYAFGFEREPEGPYQYYNAAAAIAEFQNGRCRIEKIVIALDHGLIVNPEGVRDQVMGAAVFAHSMMFKNAITFEKGRIQKSNFNDYPVSRIDEAPEFEVVFVENTYHPMGTGEKLQGTIQPAIANALSALSGQAITQIPIDLSSIKPA